jgi:hypothetical protein
MEPRILRLSNYAVYLLFDLVIEYPWPVNPLTNEELSLFTSSELICKNGKLDEYLDPSDEAPRW